MCSRTQAAGGPGSTAVRQGVNTNIAVDTKTADRRGNDDLTATLVPDPNAMAPYASLNPSITPGESVLTVGFGSTEAFLFYAFYNWTG